MKRQPTESQQQAKAERREKFAQLVKQVADLTDEQRAELASKMFVTTCEGHTLSTTNQMLVALQFGEATIVGGFNQWKAHGRTVKRGEHGIMIWIPKTKREEDEPRETPEYFFTGYVFDVSQTEALPC